MGRLGANGPGSSPAKPIGGAASSPHAATNAHDFAYEANTATVGTQSGGVGAFTDNLGIPSQRGSAGLVAPTNATPGQGQGKGGGGQAEQFGSRRSSLAAQKPSTTPSTQPNQLGELAQTTGRPLQHGQQGDNQNAEGIWSASSARRQTGSTGSVLPVPAGFTPDAIRGSTHGRPPEGKPPRSPAERPQGQQAQVGQEQRQLATVIVALSHPRTPESRRPQAPSGSSSMPQTNPRQVEGQLAERKKAGKRDGARTSGPGQFQAEEAGRR